MSANPIEALQNSPAAHQLRTSVESGGVLSFPGVSTGAQGAVAVLAKRLFPERDVLVVASGIKAQESVFQDVETWYRIPGQTDPSVKPLYYPSWEILPHENRLPHSDVISERLETLIALLNDSPERKGQIVVANVAALMQLTWRPSDLRAATRTLTRTTRIDPLDLIEQLEDQGYEPEVQVNQKGELALRGGIVDLFPPISPWPVRIEFFGDEVESLRYFDPVTQLSREEIQSIVIPPAGELGILRRRLGQSLSEASREQSAESDTLKLGSFAEFLSPGTIIIALESALIKENSELMEAQVPEGDQFHQAWSEFRRQLAERNLPLIFLSEDADESPIEKSRDSEDETLTNQTLTPTPSHDLPSRQSGDGEPHLSPAPSPRPSPNGVRAGLAMGEMSAGSLTGFAHFQSLDAFRPIAERVPDPQVAEAQRKEFFGQLHRWLRQGCSVQVVCNNDGERKRFCEIWVDWGLHKNLGDATAAERFDTMIGALSRGFLYEEGKLVVVTDAEIFGRYKTQRPRRLKLAHASATRSMLDIDFAELQEGDYIVHLQHGIGRYLGVQVLPSSPHASAEAVRIQSGEECLVIEYAPTQPDLPPPKLYVPLSESHLVSKYVGSGKSRPPLNTLGGTRWQKTKESVQEAVRDLAGEMLTIQAERESQNGHAFGADTPWQVEFESAFLFEETPDQLKAIRETKFDLERPKPMDRLICGDVGYGKTEVAIRAAFKAVMEGKQVAILVPTTVLAQQHYNTFTERMSDYPVRIELLSRFRTRREQDNVIRNLATGSVDIVIGTHRLIQNDIAFKDLGLVIVDEEQRFGVLHKEKFKRMRRMVDVLTLSATPIPRTLHLALMGARDMSTIQTPPQDRLPVETIIAKYDERIVRDAIQRELDREGQVFYLHNRVGTIDMVAKKIRELIPKARILVGHGQMKSDDLEEVMTRFVNGEADVLVCTTIIESGIDIPNANTIIIDRADRFGLSELYQLRGRVGRYKHQAFAYILLPRHGNLLTDVRKRMSAIKQYSSLGSGFKIAMRDLEIRGAGNLLGPEQSGHITAVGFELYCQLLKQSVAAAKGEKVKPRVEVQLRLDFLPLHAISLSPNSRSEPAPAGHPVGANIHEELDESPHLASPARTPAGEGGAEGAVHGEGGGELGDAKSTAESPSLAFIPLSYISDSLHRIELYRKLAQATDRAALIRLKEELRDRFGLVPAPLELLLTAYELRIIASEKGVSLIEVKDDKLMLTRHGDYLTVGGKFPRLRRKEPGARLKEIKKMLTAL